MHLQALRMPHCARTSAHSAPGWPQGVLVCSWLCQLAIPPLTSLPEPQPILSCPASGVHILAKLAKLKKPYNDMLADVPTLRLPALAMTAAWWLQGQRTLNCCLAHSLRAVPCHIAHRRVRALRIVHDCTCCAAELAHRRTRTRQQNAWLGHTCGRPWSGCPARMPHLKQSIESCISALRQALSIRSCRFRAAPAPMCLSAKLTPGPSSTMQMHACAAADGTAL